MTGTLSQRAGATFQRSRDINGGAIVTRKLRLFSSCFGGTEKRSMSFSGPYYVGSRPPTLTPMSTKTLHHPSFMPLYTATDYVQCCMGRGIQEMHPIIPTEIFCCDPTMDPGRRIPNIVCELMAWDCFRLNTPPPVMSTCVVPPPGVNPFRLGPHPIRDLGGRTVRMNAPSHPPLPRVNHIILQLTQDEDQAVTNLLKLHQEPRWADPTSTPPETVPDPIPEPADSRSGEEAEPTLSSNVQDLEDSEFQLEGCWSDSELQVANTLMNLSRLVEEERQMSG